VIFVTVGTQLPFDRLIRGVDLWAAEHPDIPVFGQTGTIAGDGYTPKHMEHSSTLSGRTGITIVDEEDMIAPTINMLLENPAVPDPLPPYAEDTLINAMRAIVFPEGIS